MCHNIKLLFAVKPKVQVVPQPQPAPEPIAPVKPKEEPYKKVSVSLHQTGTRLMLHSNATLNASADMAGGLSLTPCQLPCAATMPILT